MSLMSRFNKVKGISEIGRRLGWQGDPLKLVLDQIEKGDDTLLSEAEQEYELMKKKAQEASAKAAAKNNRIGLAKLSRRVCDRVILLVGGWTVQNDYSQESVDAMIANHRELYETLKAGRATKAHAIISNMVDDAQITNEMISEMLEEFAPLGL